MKATTSTSNNAVETTLLVILGLIVLVLLIGFVTAVAEAQPSKTTPKPTVPQTTPYDIKDPASLRAFQVFETAKAKARDAYARIIDPARYTLIEVLSKQQIALTKAGNLDEAVKLKAAGEDLVAQSGDPGRIAQALPETHWKRVLDHGGFTITFHADMSVTSTHHQDAGTWTPVPGTEFIRVSVSQSGCKSELLKLSPGGNQFVDDKGMPCFSLVMTNDTKAVNTAKR